MSAEAIIKASRAAAALALTVACGFPPAALANAAAVVQSMVVGRNGTVLAGPRYISARAGTVTVSGRRCAVAAGTPLAVLLALRRAGGPAFALRDYGHCGAAARNSGGLFVRELGGEPNRGQDGWEYKVGNVAGATGAGDPSGVQGNGRLLRSGQRVLWFWCQASAGGCERTLGVSAPASVARGGSVAVRVTGYDDEGRGAPVAGAIVRLGSDFATTDSSGRAVLIVPGTSGRYTLSAVRNGLVAAFPARIVVR